MDVNETLRAYESDPAAESTIRSTITNAYDSLRPELETINKYETEQLPSFYNAFSGFGMGTGAADIDPLSRLTIASNDVARKSAQARTARDIFSTRQAGMEDLIKSAYNQWQSGYQMAQNAWQRDMAERQLRASQVRPGINFPPTPTPETPTDPYADVIQRAYFLSEKAKRDAKNQEILKKNSGYFAGWGDNLADFGNVLKQNYSELIRPNLSSAISNISNLFGRRE